MQTRTHPPRLYGIKADAETPVKVITGLGGDDEIISRRNAVRMFLRGASPEKVSKWEREVGDVQQASLMRGFF